MNEGQGERRGSERQVHFRDGGVGRLAPGWGVSCADKNRAEETKDSLGFHYIN